MTASNRSESVYFHLENTFSVGGVAKDGSGEQGGSGVEGTEASFSITC